MSNIEELKSSHQQLIDQAAAVMLCIEKLDKESAELLDPQDDEEYWFIDSDGEITKTTYYGSYDSDVSKVALGNWFWTKEEAEKAALRIKVDLLLNKEAKKLNTVDNPKWYIYYDLQQGTIVSDYLTSNYHADVMFDSNDIALQAAENVGVDLIKQAWSRDND